MDGETFCLCMECKVRVDEMKRRLILLSCKNQGDKYVCVKMNVMDFSCLRVSKLNDQEEINSGLWENVCNENKLMGFLVWMM